MTFLQITVYFKTELLPNEIFQLNLHFYMAAFTTHPWLSDGKHNSQCFLLLFSLNNRKTHYVFYFEKGIILLRHTLFV